MSLIHTPARFAHAQGERGSAAVEYVGLALVVSMLMTAIASAIDGALGQQLASAIARRLVEAVGAA